MSEPSCRALVIRWIDASDPNPGMPMSFTAPQIHQDLSVWAARVNERPHSLSTVKTILRRFVRLGALTDVLKDSGNVGTNPHCYTVYTTTNQWHERKWAKGGWK